MKSANLVPAVGITMMLLTSCQHTKPLVLKAVHNRTVGAWTNPYQDDPNLAGVCVKQFGECPYDQHLYEGRHPCGVDFFFWDGRVIQTGYEPDGQLTQQFEWKDRLKSGDGWWDSVDFSYGSDPGFVHHKDPRKKTSGIVAKKKTQ